MSYKATSAGTKVTTGDRPVVHEGPGHVPADSLAAESARKGGAFAANPGQEQQQQQHQQQQQQPSASSGAAGGTSTTTDKTTTLGLEQTQKHQPHQPQQQQQQQQQEQGKPKAYGGPAPTYIDAQRMRDPGGPRGKNLTEGGFEGPATVEGPLPEPGSAEDPGRLAQRDLRAAAAAAASRGTEAGPRQTGVGDGHWYQPLGSDEPA